MKATVVDLRYRMKEVLKALDRNEDVKILYHGKTKGVISALAVARKIPHPPGDHPPTRSPARTDHACPP